ncbi:Uncharacterized protein MA16_Dca025212 [Dendrobium catenatum]|uniref:DUF4283 domain-containing protein n=1 Tax=Dendrobium catenatum TaxID=906689 RepID=A0A2I0XFD2_9ASPA|nr:Uncharacterized protein MA16_Dca025212 [Dendrobium catenatum]
MTRGGGLRSPPPNGGLGKGGGGKERKQGNRWQVLAIEEADDGAAAVSAKKTELPSRSPGISRFSASSVKGTAPLRIWEQKGTNPTGSARLGKENTQRPIKIAGLNGSGMDAGVVSVTKFNGHDGMFALGLSSYTVKPAAVWELILKTIGMSPPAGCARNGRSAQAMEERMSRNRYESSMDADADQFQDSFPNKGSLTAKSAVDTESEQETHSEQETCLGGAIEDSSCRLDRGSSDMENDRLEVSDREARSDMEESGKASDSHSDMEDDQRGEIEQLESLPAKIASLADQDDAAKSGLPHEDSARVSSVCGSDGDNQMLEMDCAMGESVSERIRCEHPPDQATSSQCATGIRSQGVCGFDPKAQKSAWLQPLPTQAPNSMTNGVPKKPFAWSKLQNVPLSRLSRDQWVASDGLCIEPELDSVNDNILKLDKALVAKLLGRRIYFNYLLSKLKRRWYHFGDFEVITITPNTFICLFQSHEARDAVLSSGPWIIAGNIIGMDKWSPSCSPNSLHGLHSPIWIRLTQLPLIYWDINNITRIANALGEPLWMDSHTSTWGKSSFAHICVWIDLSQKLLPGVWINGLHGRFFQRIEYEGLTNFCFDCGLVGHARVSCNTKSPTKDNSAKQNQDPQLAKALPKGPPVTDRPPKPSQLAQDGLYGYEDHEEGSLGSWNFVTRRRRNKPRAPIEQPANDQKKAVEPIPISQPSHDEAQRLEEI